MIQRIQSIFLLVAALAVGSLFKFPFATTTMAVEPYFSDMKYMINDDMILMGLTVLTGILIIAAIFLYQNRPLQKRITLVSLILSFFTAIVAVWLIYSKASEWSSEMVLNDGLGIYATAFAFICLIAANYFISKDEKTVRSMDRLR